MKPILVYDFETGGLPLFDQPSHDPRQPHIVQLAASLIDQETRKTIASVDLIAKPEGWIIPDITTEIHGITTEHALKVGVPESLIVDVLLAMWRQCDFRVGHNESFDARIMRIAMARFNHPTELMDAYKEGPAYCTCAKATAICMLPGKFGYKKPKLTEAYQHFLGKPMEGAHSASGDVDACIAVYWALNAIETTTAVAA